MSSESGKRREHPSTYFVQDRSNEAERRRITLQDTMVTQSMGGVLPEQADPNSFHRVLDVGCGTGGWLIEAAKTYPGMTTLAGADISIRMVEFARALATEQGVSDRVKFYVMDALRMIEFPQGYFDLVNHRLGWSYLRTWDWPKLLAEYQRMAYRGGVIRISESDIFGETNSPALSELHKLAREAFYKAGHSFSLERDSVRSTLPQLMHQHGIYNVQTRPFQLHTNAESENLEDFIEDTTLTFKNMVPFLQRWMRVPDNYQTLCQQAQVDMHKPDFTATWHMLTAWGTNVRTHDKLPMTEHR